MSVVKINEVWNVIAKSIYVVKIILLTVIRHHFPVHHTLGNVVRKLKNVEEPTVTIPNGKLRGKIGKNFDNNSYYSFQGIPYAKPPIGNLRFKAPQPAENWEGVWDATREGHDCISRHTVLRTLIGSEDCLKLNVYTPELPKENSKNDLKPVMFWIHGGGFTSGSGSTEAYGPEFLMTKDVVLVTINYRTGILGFFSVKDPDLGVSANTGLKDMVMALKWVQKNIEYFCGDPNNVTLFGESAGGAAIHYLMLSPTSKGLFHKAIMQSGCSLNLWASGKTYTDDLAKVLGIEPPDEGKVVQRLRDLPGDQLYKVAEKIYDPFIASKVRPYAPVIEPDSSDAFLTQHPLEIIKSGKYHHVPILIGYTTREGMLGEIVQKPRPFTPLTNFEVCVPHFLEMEPNSEKSLMLAQKIRNFYYGNDDPSTANKDKFYIIQGDNFFIRDLLRTVKYHAENSSAPIFLYRMSVDTSLNMLKKIYKITEPGVCHADDLGYLFKNLLTPEMEAGSDEELAIRRFVHFWTNFAKYAHPSPQENDVLSDNVVWKPVTKTELNFVDIGVKITAGVNPESDRMAFWDEILDEFYANKST